MTLWHKRKLAAMAVHLLTASTAIVGIYTLYAIVHNDYPLAFLLMGLAVFVDAIDGTLARRVAVKTHAPDIDGTLMDNIVDYFNYVVTPCFFALHYQPLLPDIWREILVAGVALASVFQFTDIEAKTKDHFFKGFPCYWNFVVFYMFIYQMPAWLNAVLLAVFTILVFVPIKYVYLSRMDKFIKNKTLRHGFLLSGYIFGAAAVGTILTYPQPWPVFLWYSCAFLTVYFGLSLYHTLAE